MLKEALMPFCEQEQVYRDIFLAPFRQDDCVFATDGHVLIRIRPKEAGVAICKFKAMDDFNVQKVIPQVGFEELLQARTIRRDDLRQVIDQMKQHEDATKQLASADLMGVQLSMEGVSHLEVAMRIFGTDGARLVWHKGDVVLVQIDNAKGQEAVSILQMGWSPKDAHVISIPTYDDSKEAHINWQRGLEAWAEIKAKLERDEEAARMARREVYMVQVVKIAHIPVYARNADEARQLADKEFFDPEDDGDDEWVLGDEVPEVEDVDDLEDCYKHVITRDGVVHRDEIYNLDQISEEWEKKQKKED